MNSLNLAIWSFQAHMDGSPFDAESERLDPYYSAAVYEEYATSEPAPSDQVAA